MSQNSFPVTIAVRRADGSVEQVRVGTATQNGQGFSLQLGELAIGSEPEVRRAAPAAAPRPPGNSGDAPSVFPNYGRSKGMPIAGATIGDLEYYANGCRRTLGDTGKARWHDKEKILLAAIEQEMAKQGAGGGPPLPEPGPEANADDDSGDIPF